MKRLPREPLLLAGLASLILGQLLFFVQFTTLYVVALIFVLAVALPYPRAISSWVSRVLAALLLVFSAIQLMGAAQFFVFPKSGFTVLSLLITGFVFILCYTLRGRTNDLAIPVWNKKDTAALIAMLFFVVPFAILCFWKNDPTYVLAFASGQSPDGASHFTAIAEMASTQHLDYRTVPYYPKGFHLASAFIMQGLHANASELSWTANVRVYAMTYLVWGSVLTYFVVCIASRILRTLLPKERRLPEVLLACSIGLVLAFIYLFPFAYEGFLNYYYVVSAVLLSVLFLYDYKFAQKNDDWWLVAYLLLVFGVSMSWGPLLAPALLLIPILYILHYQPKVAIVLQRYTRNYWWVLLAFVLQAAPIYLHFKYAKLNSQQGFDAVGGITNFDYGVVLMGLFLMTYLIYGPKVPKELKTFAASFSVSLYLLVGGMISIQYLRVGELRYYAIKTAYLLEVVILAVSAAMVVCVAVTGKQSAIHRWLTVPLLLGMSFVLLIGITADPFMLTQKMLVPLEHPGHMIRNPDIYQFSRLGVRGELDSTNNSDLHYDADTGYLYGNELIPNWANIMQHTTDSTPEAGFCSGKIFSLVMYTAPSAAQQAALTASVNDCIGQAFLRHRPYYIVTDSSSVAHLRALFGGRVTYLY